MDFYTTDSVSLQEMLDIDIKSEIDSVLGGHSELSAFSFADLPPLDLEDGSNDFNMWFSTSSNHSNSNFYLDFIGSEAAAKMVNPNAVLPVVSVVAAATSAAASTDSSSNSSSSPSPQIKQEADVVSMVKRASRATPTKASSSTIHQLMAKTATTAVSSPSPAAAAAPRIAAITTTALAAKMGSGGELKPHPILVQHMKTTATSTTTTTAAAAVNNGAHQHHHHHGRKQQFVTTTNISNNNNNNNNNSGRHFAPDADDRVYPKPAYSYSCLIAMALKNSRNGSLPVSEIYNFMCQHFPYFKTAPNGWKNSVRHNLSLNKCFEKIEKPALSGAQRKGCLWAMNPDKVGKMDEEVQKWSRKDPATIRKAMSRPDQLEALERGELKQHTFQHHRLHHQSHQNHRRLHHPEEELEEDDEDLELRLEAKEEDSTDESEAASEEAASLLVVGRSPADLELESLYDDAGREKRNLIVEMTLAEQELFEEEEDDDDDEDEGLLEQKQAKKRLRMSVDEEGVLVEEEDDDEEEEDEEVDEEDEEEDLELTTHIIDLNIPNRRKTAYILP